MALRDNVYLKFGPLLQEALIDAMLFEINELRTRTGLPARTKEYFLGRAHNSLAHLEPYDWMQNLPP